MVAQQNVLGVCNFDMLFQYAHYGWEGSAHDGKVLGDALGKGFPLIPNKYYLADAGYALRWYTLTPYRSVRYHLKEWESVANKPQNKQELFNLRHAQLRNVIERIFGVLKKRFKILTRMESFAFIAKQKDNIGQIDIVECCFLLHNFIRTNTNYEDEFYNEAMYDNNDFANELHVNEEPDNVHNQDL